MILVTGGYGLIGANLVKRLAREGEEVLCLDRVMNPENPFFQGCNNIHFLNGDVTDSFYLSSLFVKYNIEAIVHAAAVPNSLFCKEYPTEAVRINTLGTMNLLELARLHGVKKFIYISSASVFGKQETLDPITESMWPTPMNTYATTKKMSEELVSCYRRNYGLESSSVRISWVFGPVPELRPPRWTIGPIPYYCWKLLMEGRLVEESGLDFVANFTFVDDVSEGILCALRAKEIPEFLHLSSERLYSNREIVEFLKQKMPESEIEVKEGTEPFVLQAPLRGPLVSEYKESIGYQPKTDFQSALDQYFEWMMKELQTRS